MRFIITLILIVCNSLLIGQITINDLQVVENPFDSELCDVWGTEEYPATVGYTCVTDADYYHSQFVVPQGQIATSISIIPDSLFIRDYTVDNYGFRSTYHHYFWFDGDCTVNDDNKMAGVLIVNELNDTVYYKNRSEFAINIDTDEYTDSLNLLSGIYDVYIIHDEADNISWDFTGVCLQVDWFVGGYIWLFNSNVGNSRTPPEVYISQMTLTTEADPITFIEENKLGITSSYQYYDLIGRKININNLERGKPYFKVNDIDAQKIIIVE